MNRYLLISGIVVTALLMGLYGSTSGQVTLTAYQRHFQQNPYLKRWASQFPHFRLEAFERVRTTSFENIPPDTIELTHKDTKAYFDMYQPLLSYSPDKKRWLDPYSPQVNFEKINKGRKKLRASIEVDQVLLLGDLNKLTIGRISFLGASSWIDEAVWASNNEFILTCVNSQEKEYRPFIIIGDVKQQQFYYYETNNKNISRPAMYHSMKWIRLQPVIEE